MKLGASLAVLVTTLALACAPQEPAAVTVSRPLAVESELLTVGDTTRAGVRLDTGVQHVLPLAPLPAGRLELAVAPLGEVASVEVRLRGDSLAEAGLLVCAYDFEADDGPASDGSSGDAPSWRDCAVDVLEAVHAPELAVHATSPATGQIAVASPIHTRLGGAPAGPPVFLIVLDAARADAFRTFDAKSPFGDRLAKLANDSVRFTEARTSSPWTRPALASLMTGLTPWRHGVLERRDSLDTRFDTLAEKLADAGYLTHAYVTNPNLLPAFGFQQGFDVFRDLGSMAWKSAKVDAAPVFERVGEELASTALRPEFHWIHLMDPHNPYHAPGPELRSARKSLRGRQMSRVHVAYSAEILDVDRKIGAFLDSLHAAALYDPSLIVVVADHGEAFLEHGVRGHGKQMYEESIRVPALVKLPGGAHAGSVSELKIGLEDVHEFVLDIALGRVPVGPEAEWPAREEGGRQIAVLALGKHRKSAITEDGWKLIVDHAAGEQKLFDLTKDPGETSELSAEHPERAVALRYRLDAERSRGAAGLHLRWCGSSQPSVIEMRVELGDREVNPAELEASDTIETSEGSLHLSFNLTPRANPLKEALEAVEDFGALAAMGRNFADQDEVLLTHPAGEPAELPGRVRLHVDSPENWDVLFGESMQVQPGQSSIDLSEHTLEILVSPGDPIACSVTARKRPLLHVWYIADPLEIDRDTLAPETIERLRALGYTL